MLETIQLPKKFRKTAGKINSISHFTYLNVRYNKCTRNIQFDPHTQKYNQRFQVWIVSGKHQNKE